MKAPIESHSPRSVLFVITGRPRLAFAIHSGIMSFNNLRVLWLSELSLPLHTAPFDYEAMDIKIRPLMLVSKWPQYISTSHS